MAIGEVMSESQPTVPNALYARSWTQPLFLDESGLDAIRVAIESVNPSSSAQIRVVQSDHYSSAVGWADLLSHPNLPGQRIETVEIEVAPANPESNRPESHASAEIRLHRLAQGEEDSNIDVELFGPRHIVDQTRQRLERALASARPSYATVAHPWAERIGFILTISGLFLLLAGWGERDIRVGIAGIVSLVFCTAFVGSGREFIFPITHFHVGRAKQDDRTASALRVAALLGTLVSVSSGVILALIFR